MPKKWSKLLFQPFYPGMGNRNKVDCPALPETQPKCMSEDEAQRLQDEKRAWDDYFAGRGPKPGADGQ